MRGQRSGLVREGSLHMGGGGDGLGDEDFEWGSPILYMELSLYRQ